MALIQITADLSRVARALERIAERLEIAIPDPLKETDYPIIESIDELSYEDPSGSVNQLDPNDVYIRYGPRRNY